jgi:hypothetical protein
VEAEERAIWKKRNIASTPARFLRGTCEVTIPNSGINTPGAREKTQSMSKSI